MTQLGLALFARDVVRRESEPQEGTQNALILAALRRGERLTPKDALQRFGTMRLGARIFELKRAGHDIKSAPKKVGHRTTVSEYFMERP